MKKQFSDVISILEQGTVGKGTVKPVWIASNFEIKFGAKYVSVKFC